MHLARRAGRLACRSHLSRDEWLCTTPSLGSKRLLSSRSARSYLPYEPLPNKLPHGAILRYPHRDRASIYKAEQKKPDRGLTVAIIGASGNTGRQIAMSMIAKNRYLPGISDSLTVQFVGSREDHSIGTLIGLCSELRDAFDEFCPNLEVVGDIEAAEADIIVMAAGASMSLKYKTFPELARANVDIFDEHATGLLAKNSKAVVVIVSNPAEFAVECFVDAGFHPDRVLGFGAHLDSLRFRREIASEVGVSRQHISGMVLGKHGLDMVPCWSTVQLAPHCPPSAHEHVERLKAEGLSRMPRSTIELRKLAKEVRGYAEANEALAAAALINRQPPDDRAALRRYLSFFSGPTYPRVGIGEKCAQVVLNIMEGKDMLCVAQVQCDGSFLGIKDQAIGLPITLGCRGVKIRQIELTKKEEEAVLASAEEAKILNKAVNTIKQMRKARKAKDKSS